MQTQRQIQELLSSAGVSPNRRLGQHFLVDLNLMRLLVDSAQIGPRDVVLEIGTGTGSLTEALAQRAGHVVTVELDPTLEPLIDEVVEFTKYAWMFRYPGDVDEPSATDAAAVLTRYGCSSRRCWPGCPWRAGFNPGRPLGQASASLFHFIESALNSRGGNHRRAGRHFEAKVRPPATMGELAQYFAA
jgi:hypothetical protein